MGKTYTGVDIGSESLKLAVCDENAVKTVVVESLPEGLMADGRLVSFDAMADFIKSVVKRSSGISKDVAFVIPGADCLVRRIDIPAMTEKELALNLPFEFRDYIAQGKDRYTYDYAVLHTSLNPEGDPESLDLLAVAAMKQTIADYAAMFRRAGLRLRSAMPAQAAFQSLVGGNPKALANCCIADFSHSGTKLHFFTEGTYDTTRVIEVGGMDIDRAIASERGVDEHVAREYKERDYEGAQTSEAARQVYESIAVEMGRALNFYGFNNPEATIEVAYMCGGGSLVRPLMDTVASHTDIELRAVTDILPALQGDAAGALRCPAAVGATRGTR